MRSEQLATQLKNVGRDEQEIEFATAIEEYTGDLTQVTLMETTRATAGGPRASS